MRKFSRCESFRAGRQVSHPQFLPWTKTERPHPRRHKLSAICQSSQERGSCNCGSVKFTGSLAALGHPPHATRFEQLLQISDIHCVYLILVDSLSHWKSIIRSQVCSNTTREALFLSTVQQARRHLTHSISALYRSNSSRVRLMRIHALGHHGQQTSSGGKQTDAVGLQQHWPTLVDYEQEFKQNQATLQTALSMIRSFSEPRW